MTVSVFVNRKNGIALLLDEIILLSGGVSCYRMNDRAISRKAYIALGEDVATSTIRKLDRRFLLLLAGVTFLSYVDRSNIGYAANDLCQELKLTHEDYGKGVSLFYAGYLLSQVSGNILLKRFGAPAWISFILFAWGNVAVALGFIQNTAQFYALRFVLGIAEGGTFPAMWYIIPMFYPPEHVANAYSVIIASVSLSMPLSSPLSAGLMSLGPYVNVKGWRLLFVVEGIMPMLYAALVYFCLPASPQTASFLETKEKEWVAQSQGGHQNEHDLSFWEATKRVVSNATWRLCAFSCLIISGVGSVLMFWATLIIQDMLYEDDEDTETCGSKHSNATLAIIMTAIPFLVSGFLCLWTRRLDVRNRPRFASVVYATGGVLMISWIGTRHIAVVVRFLLLTGAITAGHVSGCYVLALAMMSCEASARSVASSILNSAATIGGIVIPMIYGRVTDVLGSDISISLFGGFFLVAALIIMRAKDPLLKKNVDREDEDSSCLQTPSSP